MGNHRGQLPTSRCPPLPARARAPTGPAGGLIRNHAPLRGAAVGTKTGSLPPLAGCGRRRLRSLPCSGGGGRGGRCTVVLARRPSSPF